MTYSAESNPPISIEDGSHVIEPGAEREDATVSPCNYGLSHRACGAYQVAEVFLGEMKNRAELRHDIEQKSKVTRQKELDILRRKADEYRDRLRKYLRPELREDCPG